MYTHTWQDTPGSLHNVSNRQMIEHSERHTKILPKGTSTQKFLFDCTSSFCSCLVLSWVEFFIFHAFESITHLIEQLLRQTSYALFSYETHGTSVSSYLQPLTILTSLTTSMCCQLPSMIVEVSTTPPSRLVAAQLLSKASVHNGDCNGAVRINHFCLLPTWVESVQKV